MESLKVFYSADEAAKKLSTGSTKLSTQDIYRLANYGRLPVCFDFRGELIKHSVDGKLGLAGEAPKILDFDGVVRSLTQPTTDGVCGFAVLAEIVEVRTLKFSHKDGKLTRGINMPTEFPCGGRIKPGHKVECWLEDADVPPSAFLFHVDDLEKLVHAPHESVDSASNAPTVPAPAVPAVAESAPNLDHCLPTLQPESVVDNTSNETQPASSRRPYRRMGWQQTAAFEHVLNVYARIAPASVKRLCVELKKSATDDSALGVRHGVLFVRETEKALTDKTIANGFPTIRAQAQKLPRESHFPAKHSRE